MAALRSARTESSPTTATPVPRTGLPADRGVNDYLWVGVDNGWTIFDKDESDLGPLDTGPGKWGGAVKQYEWV